MKKALLVALVMLSTTPALAQDQQQASRTTQNTSFGSMVRTGRETFRTKVIIAVTPANKPKVESIIAILIGLLKAPPSGEVAKAFDITFNTEAKKQFPKADATQLETLRDLVTAQLAFQLEEQLAEARVRGGVISALVKCKTDNACFQQNTSGINRDKVNAIRKEFETKMKDLEAADRMGNFEIQRLMSAYNQAETLSSSVGKKNTDTANAIISKL